VVFFAARHGTESWEGVDKDRPSIFTEALLKHMEEEGLELGRFFNKVTYSVLEAIEAIDPFKAFKQEPLVYGNIPDEDFYFKPPRRSR
jgi:Caspase domain